MSPRSYPASCRKSKTITDSQFYRLLIRYYRKYAKRSSSEDIVGFVKASSRYFSVYLQKYSRADIYIDFIFCLFEYFRSTNSDLIRNTVQEYCLRTLKHFGMIRQRLRAPSLLKASPIPAICYQPLPGYEKKFCTDYIFYDPHLLKHPTAVATFLRYGVRLKIEEKDISRFLENMVSKVVNELQLEEWTEEDNVYVIQLIDQHYVTYGERRRLYFVLLAFQILIMMDFPCDCLTRLIKGVKLLFETIPDALISVHEICSFFFITFKDEAMKSKARKYCNKFIKDFPESADPLQPRSLKHLCRCQVRENLAESKMLPHGVWKLEIPHTLYNYLLLQETEDQYVDKTMMADLPKRKRKNSDIPSTSTAKETKTSRILRKRNKP